MTPAAAPAPPARPPSPADVGIRHVRYEWCWSCVIATVRVQSRAYPTASRRERWLRGLPYSLLALLLGPWGVPWGPVGTTRAVWLNLTGGVDADAPFGPPGG